MKLSLMLTARVLLLLTLIFVTSFKPVFAQQPGTQKTAAQPDDVIRVNTELVQTDVTVFDQRGRLVKGLRPEQFELKLDGQPQPITFFEFVTTGSASEAGQVAAASGVIPVKSERPTSPLGDKRRVIFFFLDDVHLSSASLIRARKALTEFIDNQMSQNDQVAIVSTSGQIGFLQQLTDYKPMLHAATKRLSYKKNPETYAGKVPINEYEAVQVADNSDRDLFRYLVMATMNEYQAQGALQRVAANMVKNRVQQISTQARVVNTDMLDVLESLMRSSASLPGRKLVFFMSDGFVTNLRGSNVMMLLKRVTALAARSGVVVYAMDARGTIGDGTVDAGRNDFPDGMASGTQARYPSLENVAMQEPLHILADDTGGRAIINSNSFKDAFQEAIDETSEYYLLAWRPDGEAQRQGTARIKVTVKDRPGLRVRLRRNYYTPPRTADIPKPEGQKTETAPAAPTAEERLLSTLGALYPKLSIPTALSVGYMNTADQGLVLKVSMQIDRAALNLAASGPQKSEVEVIGAAVDDRGVIVTFKQLLTVMFDPATPQTQPVVWNQQLRTPPGLYQVRVAVSERSSGLTGSARQWIQMPEISERQFQISSLFLAERRPQADSGHSTAPKPLMVDVDQHFTRSSVLRFQSYVYYASADIEIETRILRDKQAVITLPSTKLPTDPTKDLSRRPYWAEISLNQLAPGPYTLEVTAIDRATKNSASQQARFVVD